MFVPFGRTDPVFICTTGLRRPQAKASIVLRAKRPRYAIERKRSAEALRRSEEGYRAVFERITDAFIAVDENWRYIYLNRKAAAILHRNPKELIG